MQARRLKGSVLPLKCSAGFGKHLAQKKCDQIIFSRMIEQQFGREIKYFSLILCDKIWPIFSTQINAKSRLPSTTISI
jgi:hypothetical protein